MGEIGNIDLNQSLNLNADSRISGSDSLFNQLETSVTQTGRSTQQNTTSTNFDIRTQISKSESFELEGEVLYKPNIDIGKQKEQFIQSLEQDRMRRVRQRQILTTLQGEKATNPAKATGYSRNLDEAVVMGTTKKERGQIFVDPKNMEPRQAMPVEEDVVMVANPSEEFAEEFLDTSADQTKQFLQGKGQRTLGGDRGQNPDDNEENKKNEHDYVLEEDEVLDLEKAEGKRAHLKIFDHALGQEEFESADIDRIATVLGIDIPSEKDVLAKLEEDGFPELIKPPGTPEDAEVTDDSLTFEIEDRMKRIAKFLDKKESKTPSKKIVKVKKNKKVQNLRTKFGKH